MSMTPIDLYWRPGCGFCMALDRGLSKVGDLPITRHNIWADPEAADYVREHANGNETVPTVRVGSVVMVNPTANQVMAALVQEHPEMVPDDYEPPQPGRIGRTVSRFLGG
ncbi:MAG: NrdH-redoxin [Actinomycetia bacterium]|nr:NrdH-redoxin [Actinomycetes bacterium]MCP4962286.1 NrdH-redoxin [Actinomycetes bacterium]